MRFRFRYVDGSGRPFEVNTVEELTARIRTGEVTESTLLYDALTGEWTPARYHSVYHLLLDGPLGMRPADETVETPVRRPRLVEASPATPATAPVVPIPPAPKSPAAPAATTEGVGSGALPAFEFTLSDRAGRSTEEAVQSLLREREREWHQRGGSGKPAAFVEKVDLTTGEVAQRPPIEVDPTPLQASPAAQAPRPAQQLDLGSMNLELSLTHAGDEPARDLDRWDDEPFTIAAAPAAEASPAAPAPEVRAGLAPTRARAAEVRSAEAAASAPRVSEAPAAPVGPPPLPVVHPETSGQRGAATPPPLGKVAWHQESAAIDAELESRPPSFAPPRSRGLRGTKASSGGPVPRPDGIRPRRRWAWDKIALAGALAVAGLSVQWVVQARTLDAAPTLRVAPGLMFRAINRPDGEPAQPNAMAVALAGTESTAFEDMIEAMDSLRIVYRVDQVPAAWLDGRYLAEPSDYPEVRNFWIRYLAFLEEMEESDGALFKKSYVRRLEEQGLRGPMVSMRVSRAMDVYETSGALRTRVYHNMRVLGTSALSLHKLLVDNEGDIRYEPALAASLSRDPVVEAVPAGPELERQMWGLLDRIFFSLGQIHGASPGSTTDLTARILEGIRSTATVGAPTMMAETID